MYLLGKCDLEIVIFSLYSCMYFICICEKTVWKSNEINSGGNKKTILK